MSKYTTEVRFICEHFSGMSESVGFSHIDDIVEKARTKIFGNYTIFDEEYRSILECKILKHFYTREIGFETVGLWKFKLNQKMNEIMPFYNQLYQSEKIEINPLSNNKSVTDFDRKNSNSSQSINNRNRTNKNVNNVENLLKSNVENVSSVDDVNSVEYGSNVSTNGTDDLSKSDTPQGTLENVENNTYLSEFSRNKKNASETKSGKDTNKRIGNEKSKSQQTNENKENKIETNTEKDYYNENKTDNTLEKYITRLSGYSGISESELLKQYRDSFLNIDMLVIDELSDLFMLLW